MDFRLMLKTSLSKQFVSRWHRRVMVLPRRESRFLALLRHNWVEQSDCKFHRKAYETNMWWFFKVNSSKNHTSQPLLDKCAFSYSTGKFFSTPQKCFNPTVKCTTRTVKSKDERAEKKWFDYKLQSAAVVESCYQEHGCVFECRLHCFVVVK